MHRDDEQQPMDVDQAEGALGRETTRNKPTAVLPCRGAGPGARARLLARRRHEHRAKASRAILPRGTALAGTEVALAALCETVDLVRMCSSGSKQRSRNPVAPGVDG